jgi:Domain of unknown function (DUF4129)
MRTERLSFALRTRTPWEAADLGIALVRENAAAIWSAWLWVVLPVALLIGLVFHLWLGELTWASIVLWWLKPVFDRIPLFVLSRAVFGSVPSVAQTLQAQRSSADIGPLLWWLTWRRLNPMRALYLPIDFLERLSGNSRRARGELLARAQGSPSTMLTVLCVNMEGMLMISLLMCGLIFVPTEFLTDSAREVFENLLNKPPLWAQWLGYLAYVAALSVIEPFYVGAGFGLYLNRRMALEAWDIDLAFRELGARARGLLRGGAILGTLFACLLLSHGAAHAGATFGDTSGGHDSTHLHPYPPARIASSTQTFLAAAESESESDTQESEDPSQTEGNSEDSNPEQSWNATFGEFFVDHNPRFDDALKKALSDADFHPSVKTQRWQAKTPAKEEKKVASNAMDFSGLGIIGQGFAFIVQNLLWVVIAILIALLLPYLLRLFGKFDLPRLARRELDAVNENEIEEPEALPTDVADEVQKLWQRGERRAALALLYRAGVVQLCERMGVPLPRGATESECLGLARQLPENDDYRSLFQALVRTWQGIAYASLEPSWAEVQALIARWQDKTGSAPARLASGGA